MWAVFEMDSMILMRVMLKLMSLDEHQRIFDRHWCLLHQSIERMINNLNRRVQHFSMPIAHLRDYRVMLCWAMVVLTMVEVLVDQSSSFCIEYLPIALIEIGRAHV